MGPPLGLGQQTVLELPLDEDLLKVLSSDSRREILRLLTERRMTGSELAHRLELGKPAVAEHLKRLTEAELITRLDDPERKWVYYELSARGRSLLEPQKVRFYLVLGVAFLAMALGVALAFGLQAVLGSLSGGPEGAGGLGIEEGGLGEESAGAAGTDAPAGGLQENAGAGQSILPAAVTLHLSPGQNPTSPDESRRFLVPSNETFEISLEEAPPELSNASLEGLVLVFSLDGVDEGNATVVAQAVAVPPPANETLPAAPGPAVNGSAPPATDPQAPDPTSPASSAPEPAGPPILVCRTIAVPDAPKAPAPSAAAPSPSPSASLAPVATGLLSAPPPSAPPPSPAPAVRTVIVCNLVPQVPAAAPPSTLPTSGPDPTVAVESPSKSSPATPSPAVATTALPVSSNETDPVGPAGNASDPAELGNETLPADGNLSSDPPAPPASDGAASAATPTSTSPNLPASSSPPTLTSAPAPPSGNTSVDAGDPGGLQGENDLRPAAPADSRWDAESATHRLGPPLLATVLFVAVAAFLARRGLGP